nr:hypothetical protein [Bartonella senegalensis]
MKLIKKVMLMCVVSSLVGCGTNKYVSCVGWLPIYLNKRDVNVISSSLARDILKHNTLDKRLCGWKHG